MRMSINKARFYVGFKNVTNTQQYMILQPVGVVQRGGLATDKQGTKRKHLID